MGIVDALHRFKIGERNFHHVGAALRKKAVVKPFPKTDAVTSLVADEHRHQHQVDLGRICRGTVYRLFHAKGGELVLRMVVYQHGLHLRSSKIRHRVAELQAGYHVFEKAGKEKGIGFGVRFTGTVRHHQLQVIEGEFLELDQQQVIQFVAVFGGECRAFFPVDLSKFGLGHGCKISGDLPSVDVGENPILGL